MSGKLKIKNIKANNAIIKDIQRGTFDGIGRPEPLKDNLRVGGTKELMKQIELFIAKKKKRLLSRPAKDITMVKEQV